MKVKVFLSAVAVLSLCFGAGAQIPVVHIYTENGNAIDSRERWTNIESFMLIDPNNPEHNIERKNLPSKDRVRGRGNSTWQYNKKPYRIRFRENLSFFGLPARENWVLLAEFRDPTFLANATTLYLGRNVFDHQPFTNTYHWVELYLNGEYQGLYGFTEHRQADPLAIGAPGRVKIDLTEGWFTEFIWGDYFEEETDPKFITENYTLYTVIKSPDFGSAADIANSGYKFIMDDWNGLLALMACESFPQNGYRDLIDINTFIDFLMANEIVLNVEMQHPNSTFAYKEDKCGKISMGPLWDFDIAFGWDLTTWNTLKHTYFRESSIRIRNPLHGFFRRLFEDPVFLLTYKERWNEKYEKISDVSDFINEIGVKLATAAARDAERWSVDGGYWEDYPSDYLGEIARMTNWWNSRIDWLNTELNKIEVIPAIKNFKPATCGYSEISPQKFTLVAYGEMSELAANLRKETNSDFEISAELKQTATENGGFLATISVKPKNSLSAGNYADILHLSGKNQENDFSVEIPLNFLVNHSGDCTETSIGKIQKSDGRHGIRFTQNIVSDKAEISVILPASTGSATGVEARIVIYDMTGNVIWASTGSATTATGGAIVWDLRNNAGRFVANGTYFVVAEVKGANGKIYAYSTKLGVKR